MFSTYRTIELLSMMLVAVMFLPTVNYFFPESILLLLLPLVLVVSNPSILINKAMASFLIFIIFIIQDQWFSNNPIMSSRETLVSYLMIFIWTALSFYYRNNLTVYFRIIKYGVVFILITVVLSFFWSFSSADIVRQSVSESNISNTHSRLGLMNYGFAHALPLTFPMLIFIAKNEQGIKKYFIYSMLILSLILLFWTSITTSFFTGLAISVMAFFIHDKNMTLYYASLLLIFFTLFFFGKDILIYLLELIQPFSEGNVMEKKIVDLFLYLEYGDVHDGQLSFRVELREKSMNAFGLNVLMGSQDKTETGGHAFFADYLAYFGLVGFSPFLFFIYLHVSYFIKKINSKLRPYYLLSVSYFIVLSILKGRPVSEMFCMLLFVLPGIAQYVSFAYFNIYKVSKMH